MGGGSGMGIAGIQIAKLFKCDVIATAGTREKMDKCLEIGADHVVNIESQIGTRKLEV